MAVKRYRGVVVLSPREVPDDADIGHIERLLGARLPQSFVAFLASANGGNLPYAIRFESPDGTIERSFGGLFRTGLGVGSFADEITHARRAGVPRGVLPIARDGGAGVLYLDLTKEGAGRVMAFVPSMPDWAGPPARDGYFEVAASFDEYVDNLVFEWREYAEYLADGVERGDEVLLKECVTVLDNAMPRWRDDERFWGFEDVMLDEG